MTTDNPLPVLTDMPDPGEVVDVQFGLADAVSDQERAELRRLYGDLAVALRLLAEAQTALKACRATVEEKQAALNSAVRAMSEGAPLFDGQAAPGGADESWRDVPLAEALEGIPGASSRDWRSRPCGLWASWPTGRRPGAGSLT